MPDSLRSLASVQRRKSGQNKVFGGEDPIGELFQVLQMQSVFYTQTDLTAPWGMAIPAIAQSLMFHFVVEGECCVEVEGKNLAVRTGDFFMIPHGQGHSLKDRSDTSCLPLFDLPIETVSGYYETLNYGGGGKRTRLLCGAVSFDHPIAERLLATMPPYICIDSRSDSEGQFLNSTMSMLASETKAPNLGSEAVITRLADLLVIHSLRAWLTKDMEGRSGWLSALQDRTLGKALLSMHKRPGERWTIEKLAQVAGMSRTTFAEKFKERVGQAPLQYLTEWRMAVAKSKLETSHDSILEIALDLGYQSEAAFSRAYKKTIGSTPGTSRKNSRG
jgi:AraC-like DNA-binding protein